jgi:signal peptidase I
VAKKENSKEKNKVEQIDEEEKPKETTVEFLSSLAVVLVTGLFIITFAVQAFEIPSSSMENTLLIGDHVFVNRIQFAPRTNWIGPLVPYRDVHFQDIVVFLHPDPAQAGIFVVKRIIGLPGDRIHLRNGVVYRNGVALNEPYIDHEDDRYDPYRNDFPSVPPIDDGNMSANWMVDLPSYIKGDDIVVPPGHYFAMGDHRGVSLDSRYWGFIPKENIIGRPMFIYWSFETPGDQYLKAAWSDRLKFILGHEILHFFDETRWKRTLQVVR